MGLMKIKKKFGCFNTGITEKSCEKMQKICNYFNRSFIILHRVLVVLQILLA